MTSVLVVYATSLGNTKRLAEAIAAGAKSVDSVGVQIKMVDEASVDDVWACDALVLGSPVRHGSADSRIRHFIEGDCERLALTGRLAGKVGGVFTVGGHHGRHGDGGEIAQIAMLRALAAAGMTLVSAPCESRDATAQGPYWGPHARLRIQDDGREVLFGDALDTAHLHGVKVASVARALQQQPATVASKPSRWPRVVEFLVGHREHPRSAR